MRSLSADAENTTSIVSTLFASTLDKKGFKKLQEKKTKIQDEMGQLKIDMTSQEDIISNSSSSAAEIESATEALEYLKEIKDKMIKEEEISFTKNKCNTDAETCKRLASAYNRSISGGSLRNPNINTQDIEDNSEGVCAMKMERNERGEAVISFNLNGEGSFICEKTSYQCFRTASGTIRYSFKILSNWRIC